MTIFVVGVTGFAQHGKDSVGKYLVDQYDFKQFAFADTLKSMALVLNPVVLDYADGEGTLPRLRSVVDEFGWEEAKRNPEVRRFLQVLGTEAVRNHLGEDAWVNACWLAIEKSGASRVVVTDARFPNEAEAIHAWKGTLVRVARPGYENGVGVEHPSERYISSLPVDFEIVNDGTIADLHKRVDSVLTDILVHAMLSS